MNIGTERETAPIENRVPRQPRVAFPGAIYHLMSRGDRCEDIFLDDVDRQDFLKTLAEAKLAIAARLRKETTLTLKDIAQRLNLGTRKSANTNLHRYLKASPQRPLPFENQMAIVGL